MAPDNHRKESNPKTNKHGVSPSPPRIQAPAMHPYAAGTPWALTFPGKRVGLSCHEVGEIVRSAGRYMRELSFLQQDLERMEKGKKIFYLLDYSELHSFLWPDSSKSPYKAVPEQLFTSSPFQFTLPPGAIFELVHKLSFDMRHLSRERRFLSDLLNNPFFAAFVPDESSPARSAGPRLTSHATKGIDQALDGLRRSDLFMERLSKLSGLFDSGKLQFLSSIVDVGSLTIAHEVYYEAMFQLSCNRPSRDFIVNEVDAHNYALTYNLNNLFYKKHDLYFLLVTSSPIPYQTFETIKWKEDPLYLTRKEAIIKTSLVRHPTQLIQFAGVIQAHRRGITKLGKVIKNLEVIQRNLGNIAAYARYEQKRDIPANTCVKLPRNKQFIDHAVAFASYYWDTFRPTIELISNDASREENRRRIRGLEPAPSFPVPFAGEAQLECPLNDLRQQMDYRRLMALYDRLLFLGEKELTRATAALGKLPRGLLGPIDKRGMFHPKPQLRIKSAQVPEGGPMEFTVLLTRQATDTRRMYLAADRYRDYWCYWWPTNADLAEFIKASRYYVQSCSYWGSKDENPLLPIKEKEYNGIYIYLKDSIRHFPPDAYGALEVDNILRLFEGSWKVRFVRIALPVGDLWYDIESISPFPQRAGLITHLRYLSPIRDLVQWTHSLYLDDHTLTPILSKILA